MQASTSPRSTSPTKAPQVLTWVPAVCLLLAALLLVSSGRAAAPQVELHVTDWAGVERMIASHAGKVVLVDIWTTTCLACVQEFPHFVALQERFGRDEVALISVACDYDGIEGKPPEYYREKVQMFLEEQQATFDNVLLNVPLIDFLDQISLASTPAILVYGPDGKLVQRFDNADAYTEEDAFTVDDVARLVEPLLAERG